MRLATLLTFAGVIWASTAWVAAQANKAALVGVVVDGKGQPVVDAKVEVFQCLGRGFWHLDVEFRDEWTAVASASVNKSGRFGLQVPAGTPLRVQVRHASFALWRVDEHVLDKELRIELQEPCTFRGRLVSAATGLGVPGTLRGNWSEVTRNFAGRTEIFRGRTDAQGNFEFTHLPPGPFTCMPEPDSHVVPAWWKGELRADAVCVKDFELQPGITLRGRVLDAATKKPIGGALLGQGWYSGRPERAARDGTFELRGLDEKGFEVACLADGYVRELFEQSATAADVTQDFVLARGSEVRGTVVDPSGKPKSGIYVAAVCARKETTWLSQRTGADGGFHFAGLPEGHSYLVLRGDGYAFAVYHLPQPGADRLVEVGALPLQPEHLVRAVVRDAQGKPAAGARMRLLGINADMERFTGGARLGFAGGASGLRDRFAYTDSSGTVCLGAVAIGKYLLGFDADLQPMVPDNAIEVEVTAKGAPADLIVSR